MGLVRGEAARGARCARRVPSLPLQRVEDVARRVEVGRALGEDEADAARLRELKVAVEHL